MTPTDPAAYEWPDLPCERCVFIPTPDGKCICRAAWEGANAPVPDWGWDALPDDEKEAWKP